MRSESQKSDVIDICIRRSEVIADTESLLVREISFGAIRSGEAQDVAHASFRLFGPSSLDTWRDWKWETESVFPEMVPTIDFLLHSCLVTPGQVMNIGIIGELSRLEVISSERGKGIGCDAARLAMNKLEAEYGVAFFVTKPFPLQFEGVANRNRPFENQADLIAGIDKLRGLYKERLGAMDVPGCSYLVLPGASSLFVLGQSFGLD